MIKGMHIKSYKKNIKDTEIITYNNPGIVYMPLINQNDSNVTCLVKKGDCVNIGTIIGKRRGNFRIPIVSSVSGKVLETCEKYYLNGTLVKCVVIENDFKDTKENNSRTRKNIDKMSKDDFITAIRDAGITGCGGSGFPTYIKYQADNLDTLIVNMVECEPYITADYVLVKNYVEYILEAVDAILDINGMEKAYLAIKADNAELIDLLNDYLGTYLHIHLLLVKDTYPAGWERMLVKRATKREYKLLPSEVGVVVSNVSTIYAIYEALKYHKPLIERIVTFSGPGLKTNANIKVKVGTLVSEIVEHIGGYQDGDYMLVAGGPMMGTSIPSDDLVVSSNMNAVLVLPYEENKQPSECLHCGRCASVCPAGLTPVIIKNNMNNIVYLKKLHPEKCINCGACSYICPAHLRLKDIVGNAKKKVVEERHEEISNKE